MILARDQGILVSERIMLQKKPLVDLSDFEVTSVRKYLKNYVQTLPFFSVKHFQFKRGSSKDENNIVCK